MDGFRPGKPMMDPNGTNGIFYLHDVLDFLGKLVGRYTTSNGCNLSFDQLDNSASCLSYVVSTFYILTTFFQTKKLANKKKMVPGPKRLERAGLWVLPSQ